MPLLSKAINRIQPSPTVAITGQALALAEQGRDIITLSAGEPDFDTPAHIRTAAIEAINAGHTRYTAVGGIAPLKSAVADKFARENMLDYSPEEVIVSSGGKHILYNALMASVNQGDEVIIPAPYWVSYPEMVRLAGGCPVIIEAAQDNGFRITPTQLAAAISPHTKWVILNSPSNPSGACYDADDLHALTDVIVEHSHVWLLSDDIYEHITYDGFKSVTPAQVEPRLKDRTLTMNGVSKAYAMTGWRIGYAAGPKPLIKAMAKLQSQSTSNPCCISQYAALAALTGPQDHIVASRRAFERRRDLVVAGLNDCDGISCPTPRGAFYVFPSIAGLMGKTAPNGRVMNNDQDFATALLDHSGVAVVFGAAFGLSPHFRVSYAADDAVLRRAIDLIAGFCAACD